VLTVTDGARLGTVKEPFVLAGASSLPSTGKVAFALRGPSSVTIIDGRAPYKVAVDPRRMKLRDGTYSVSVRVAGSSSRNAVATLIVKTGRRAQPAPTAPKATTKPTTAEPKQTVPKPTATSATRTVTTAPVVKMSATAAEVIKLTNAERTANGCRALTTNAALTRAAQGHSDDMAAKNYFSHPSQDGRSPFDRMKAAGYSYRMAAENIAAGQRTPQAVVSGWMNSEGHRKNILNCSLTEIGVGVATGGSYGIYWTQNFGTPM